MVSGWQVCASCNTSEPTATRANMGEHDTCSVEQYVNGDNDLAVCVDLDDHKWEENFMDNLVQEEIADTTEEESDVDEEFDISLPSPKI